MALSYYRIDALGKKVLSLCSHIFRVLGVTISRLSRGETEGKWSKENTVNCRVEYTLLLESKISVVSNTITFDFSRINVISR